ncbi:hypothetical protein RI129_003990 [Pyrocoelia pectoralis]|uniref:Aftiphilin clathrin-binding box domain-containing protein n=1 Tax=Pyrocoelia pectoralis TaxID=417401 RepID=A0AAN7VRX7_9COLE
MSNIIPPLLNSSPPPMVSTILLDDDDEFGTFTMATDLHSDTDVLPPTCELPIPNINSIDDELDRRKNENENEASATKYNGFQYFPEIPPDISPEICDLEEDDKEISEILENELSNCTVVNDIKPISVDVATSSPQSVDDFADFHTYTQNEMFEAISDSPNCEIVDSDLIDEENDDEFGDFNDYSVQSCCNIDLPPDLDDTVKVMFPIFENLTEDFVQEDFTSTNVIFVQLKDITDTPALLYQWSKSNSQSCLLQALNIDTRNILYGPRWNESMPRYAATLGFTPLEPVKSDVLPNIDAGQELVQQTDIPSAEFDWVGSGLVNPLEITPSKIEKQQTNNSTLQQESISQTQLEPNNGSDSINTLQVLEKPDTDFDDFHCFQSVKAEERTFDTWPMSLRETHISNVKLDDPSWLKPTILTPELPRRELQNEDEFANFQSGNFDSIQDTKVVPEPRIIQESKSDPTTLDTLEPCKSQMALTTTEPLNNSVLELEPKLPDVQVDDDDEFTEFQSTSCVTPAEPPPIISESLQPEILQPVKVESVQPSAAPTTINWPDPGITEDDFQRFSLYKPNIKETVVENEKRVEDDDWSDFVSNQTAQMNNLHITQPVQNGFQTSLVSNQYVVFASKPDEVEDEWSDFVSSEPHPEPPIFNRPPRTSLPKLNLDWNGPPQFSSWSASIAPNIIANPTSFESFQGFTSFDGDLLKNRIANKKTPNMVQPKKNTVPSISTIPDLEFIAPKNRTWKK